MGISNPRRRLACGTLNHRVGLHFHALALLASSSTSSLKTTYQKDKHFRLGTHISNLLQRKAVRKVSSNSGVGVGVGGIRLESSQDVAYYGSNVLGHIEWWRTERYALLFEPRPGYRWQWRLMV